MKKKKILIMSAIIAVLVGVPLFSLHIRYGIFDGSHKRAVRREKRVLMDSGMGEAQAEAVAEERVTHDEEIWKRIRAGEKIDGYDGYHACRDEVLFSDFESAKIQIADMVFDQSYCMSVEDVRKVVEASQYAGDFQITDVFYAYYQAIEVKDKDGHEVLSFMWRPLKTEDCPWVDKTQNFLCMVRPTSYGPWKKESAYYPGGYQYYYKDFCAPNDDTTEETDDYKRITREALLKDLYSRKCSSSMVCDYGDDCYCFNLGETSTTAGFVDKETRDYGRYDDMGRYEFFQTTHEYEFEFDTDGNCINITPTGTASEWRLLYKEADDGLL